MVCWQVARPQLATCLYGLGRLSTPARFFATACNFGSDFVILSQTRFMVQRRCRRDFWCKAPLEEQVWALVSDVLLNPRRLENGLKRMVEKERSLLRDNPEVEVKTWANKLAEVERKRSGFQDMAAEGLITLEELRAKLNALEETRKVARTELDALASRSERVAAIERDAKAVLRDYAGLMPEALGALASEERHRVYKMLRLKVLVYPNGGGELTGVFGQGIVVGPPGITPGSLSSDTRRHKPRPAITIFAQEGSTTPHGQRELPVEPGRRTAGRRTE